jgi:excisionase family DNA binding protein
MDEDLMRVNEVVEHTGKSKATVYRWIATNRLRATKIGNEVFVYRDSLAALQEADEEASDA